MSQVQHCVLILYKHALLGKGIAQHLRAQLGVEAMNASADDPEAVIAALGHSPAIVIFEMGDTLRHFDLTVLAPQAVLIDVSTVVARGPAVSSGVAGMEKILDSVRQCMKVHEQAAKAHPGEAPEARSRSSADERSCAPTVARSGSVGGAAARTGHPSL